MPLFLFLEQPVRCLQPGQREDQRAHVLECDFSLVLMDGNQEHVSTDYVPQNFELHQKLQRLNFATTAR